MENIYQTFFSHCPKMERLRAIIDETAKTDVTVLIKGESGAGKDLVAHAIHLQSRRREKPFVKVNCAAIPRGLLESELFGFEKGAFTGAHLKKPGKFELANEGTILLDEISEIDISVQAKLLQVLQDGGFSRLGGHEDILVDTRVIATTKDHLEKSMAEGKFREDLFFRINVISIAVPPLRDRKEQIAPLSTYFLNLYTAKYGRVTPFLSSKAAHAFKEYDWPGNIRELENLIKRIVIFGDEDKALRDMVSNRWSKEGTPESVDGLSHSLSKGNPIVDLKEVGRRAAETAETEAIQATLQETHWNRKEAAKLLRVSYKALLYKIEKYHLNRRSELQTMGESQDENC